MRTPAAVHVNNVNAFTPLMIALTRLEARLLDDAVSPLVEALVRHNGSTGHLRTLVRLLLEMMKGLREESKCER